MYGIVEDIEVDTVSVAVCFGKDAVFAAALGFDADIMLRQPAKHIFAFSDVNKVVIYADAVNAGVFIFL